MMYADVILPLAVANTYTYLVPPALLSIQPGMRVRVPLGRSRCYTGVVLRVHEQPQEGVEYKAIEACWDTQAVATHLQLKLWQWIASYYVCTLGEVMCAALPADCLRGKYHPRKETCLRVGREPDKMTDKQRKAWLQLHRQVAVGMVRKADFVPAYCSAAVLQKLCASGAVELYACEVSRIQRAEVVSEAVPLTEAQQRAYEQVCQEFATGKPVLLHGVASSGKTEIYIRLIQDCLRQGKQVLYLVPEIALTTQLANRLHRVFGDSLLTIHSRMSDAQRAEAYLSLRGGKRFQVVLGPRSALFMPWQNLGLVIVDEEQESSYKQQESAPRYHARSTALMLARAAGCPALLGSATPAVETYSNVCSGKYRRVWLGQRYADSLPPHIVLIDREKAFRQHRMKDMFSWYLLEQMQATLQRGEQVLLFQNRRGFAAQVECPVCAYVPRCPHCDVSLSYHKGKNCLVCHHCDYSQPLVEVCPKCGHTPMKESGMGTEKVMECLATYFPDVPAARLDIDAVQSRGAYERILQDFSAGKTRILVGTQLLAKGMDFDRLTLVGILNADNLLNYPDYRAEEHTFRLLLQVAGRAGRRNVQGQVVLQTAQPNHPIIQALLQADYEVMYFRQMQERKTFLYPPFCRLIEVQLKHPIELVLEQAARRLARSLCGIADMQLVGPYTPLISRQRNHYVRCLQLKCAMSGSISSIKQALLQHVREFRRHNPCIRVIVDVEY